jgi:hypothetical protein
MDYFIREELRLGLNNTGALNALLCHLRIRFVEVNYAINDTIFNYKNFCSKKTKMHLFCLQCFLKSEIGSVLFLVRIT